jgi:DNA modification methylase
MRRNNAAESRKYRVKAVEQAKNVSLEYLKSVELDKVVTFGLPEIDDRYHYWRVPLIGNNNICIGEIVIDAFTSLILEKKTTKKPILESRLLGRNKGLIQTSNNSDPKISSLRYTVGLGDCEELLLDTPNESIDLVFTSPPYFNARPEYSDYITYEEYLLKMRKVIHQCHRVLNEGRFFVINISPVLIRRANRTESSKRLAVPFDFHRIFVEEDYDFIDDIIWVKPEGAGWATGRGRRFAADRNPLQYKPVPITEYILVYRKHTDKLIDWHIRKHPDQNAVKKSTISDGYEVTNVWKIHPRYDKKHPAVFPHELAEKVISYYSFVNDIVLDPFAGIGTVGEIASKLNRRFILFEINSEYVNYIKSNIEKWLKVKVKEVNWVNCDPVEQQNTYLEF